MRNDKIFFHIKQILHRGGTNFPKLWCKLLLNSPKKLPYGIAFAYLNRKWNKHKCQEKSKNEDKYII